MKHRSKDSEAKCVIHFVDSASKDENMYQPSAFEEAGWSVNVLIWEPRIRSYWHTVRHITLRIRRTGFCLPQNRGVKLGSAQQGDHVRGG